MKLRLERQRGISVVAAALILILIFFTLLIAMRVAPIYIQYFQLRRIVESAGEDARFNKSGDVAAVRKTLSRRIQIDYINVVGHRDLKVYRRGGTTFVDIKYEDRRNLIYNLDIIGKFDETHKIYP